MKETRLLHFSRKDVPCDQFKLSAQAKKGLPISIPLQQSFTETKILSDHYESGLLEAITEVVGEGGIMDGWFVHVFFTLGFFFEERVSVLSSASANDMVYHRQVYAIGKCYRDWDGMKNVNVIIVRERLEDDGLASTMLPNPFSEEDADRHIAEFKSWPHKFPPNQLVYAGFRSALTAHYPDTAICYACSLVLQSWKAADQPLSLHLSTSPACPIALEIQQSKTEIEEKIKQDTLAQIIKQREIRRENAAIALALPLQ
ncbi:MAG: hypothetical protein LQ337_004333 [Flavoplaca oasis]|nr:MAG: hypothetical protein LQ337_004333 [Flavoplaca oasis]